MRGENEVGEKGGERSIVDSFKRRLRLTFDGLGVRRNGAVEKVEPDTTGLELSDPLSASDECEVIGDTIPAITSSKNEEKIEQSGLGLGE